MTSTHRFGTLTAAVLVVLCVACGSQQITERAEPANDAAREKQTTPQQVFLVRHAEKPLDDSDIHLTSRGAARAAALPSLFAIPPTFPTKPAPFPKPDFLIAAKASKLSNRSVETLTPLAKALDQPIDLQHGHKEFAILADHLFDDAKYAGKTVLIGWHHGSLPELAVAIAARAKNGAKLKGQIPVRWAGTAFDRVWVFTFDEAQNATFADQPQQLLFGDSKN